MSTLILFLPPRSHLRAQGQPAFSDDSGNGYAYLLSADGQTVSRQGHSVAALLPAAATVIAVPAEADIAWQQLELPRAGRQMRSALAGMLEESLLDDPESLHFAVEPDRVGGDTAWVAVTARAALMQQLALLEAAQVFVDRIVPLSMPTAQPQGHFQPAGSSVALRWSHPGGVVNLPLDGALTRQLLPEALLQKAVWTATPAVAAQAEQWLGSAVSVITDEQRALALIDSPWNLRQFELAQRTRGLRTVRQAYRQFMQPQWRPVRIGLAALLAVQVLGLNLLAWRQNQQLQAGKAALSRTLTDSYPQVRAVLDAPLQMQRETELLRASAGRPGDQDLEALLAAAATAWPAERGPADGLSFEPGRLIVPATGWTEAQIAQFRSQLQSDGWQLDSAEGRLTLSRPPVKPGNGHGLMKTPQRLSAALGPLRAQWHALGTREQSALRSVGWILAVLVLWLLAVQPAWRTLQQAPAKIDEVERQLQTMQSLAAEARVLKAVPAVAAGQAALALQAASDHLGDAAKLSISGDRAVLTFNGIASEPLLAWLGEVRSAARARPVQAQLLRGPKGYSGTIVLALNGASP